MSRFFQADAANNPAWSNPETVKVIAEMGAYDELNRYSGTTGRMTKAGRENRPSPVCSKCYTRNGFSGKKVWVTLRTLSDGSTLQEEQFVCTECLERDA